MHLNTCSSFLLIKKESSMKRYVVKMSLILAIISFVQENLLSQTKEKILVIENKDKVAEFPGGQTEMHKYLANNLKYPKDGTTCVEGNVFVNFCVNENGSISNIKVVKGLCIECDAEAVRVVSIMPKWKPALEYGTNKPLKSTFTIPCRFRLE